MWKRGKDAMMDPLADAVQLLCNAERVVVLTGAGMSAESGVPTFREALTGWWEQYDPEELATEGAFRRNPERVFAWYVSRLHAVRRAEPHAGYHALVRLATHFEGAFTVVTQNVDGLHSRAGSRDVVELHGSLEAFRCIACRHPGSPDDVARLDDATEAIPPPACEKCGNFMRPGVVWFGEMLPVDAMERAWRAAKDADVALVVGTSSLVYPAAELPSLVAAAGGRIVEINPDETPLTRRADVHWSAAAGEALPALVAALSSDTTVNGAMC
jgi:NAD-dependent deacetylase